MKEVIVFGTGSGGRKIKNMMQGLGFCVNAFVDNASDKQGILFEGIATYSPDYLHNNDFPIIIASVYEEEIKKQLEDMGVGERIIYREECTYRYIQEHLEEYDYIDSYKPPHTRDALTFVFGLDLGLFYGGIESWAYIFADALRDRGYQVKFITTTKSKPAPDRFHADTYYLDLDGEDYLAVVHATIQKILENTPCVLIDGRISACSSAQSFVAGAKI